MKPKNPGKWLPATRRGRILLAALLIVTAAGGIIGLRYEFEIKRAWRRWRNEMPESVWLRLRDAKTVTVYSLYPNKDGGVPKFAVIPELKDNQLSGLPLFNGYPILGEFISNDTNLFQVVADGLRDATRHPDAGGMNCFEPRHGLRVTDAGGTFDLVICMSCWRFNIYEDGKEKSHHGFFKGMHAPFPPQEHLEEAIKKQGLPGASTETR